MGRRDGRETSLFVAAPRFDAASENVHACRNSSREMKTSVADSR